MSPWNNARALVCHARDGAFPQQSAHGEGVYAKGEDPGLGSLVVGGRGGVQRYCKPLPWLKGQRFHRVPAAVALQRLWHLQMALRLFGDPAMGPQGFFQGVL